MKNAKLKFRDFMSASQRVDYSLTNFKRNFSLFNVGGHLSKLGIFSDIELNMLLIIIIIVTFGEEIQYLIFISLILRLFLRYLTIN